MLISSEAAAITAAADARHHHGPVAALGRGQVPRCFGPLLEALGEKDVLAPSADRLSREGPDLPAEALAAELLTWAEARECVPSACTCRADRFLRRLLAACQVPLTTWRSPELGRDFCVVAGNPATGRALRIDSSNSIDHPVRAHGGWRIRTTSGSTLVFASPGYPRADAGRYYEDTRLCVSAALDALP
ncbi:hypothetical protein [Kitasatospora sp. NPDC088783]|uniref:hypothetical protein n=1 Tax=Kitasatospora sp. NPDC088783 TaxID=3364077 RepID=UPI00381EDD09